MASKERDYKKEYRDFHGTPKQKKLRAMRNKAHAQLNPPKGYEVDHKKPLSKGGSGSRRNLRITSRHTNRVKAAR